MKKKALFLVLTSCALFLAGCDGTDPNISSQTSTADSSESSNSSNSSESTASSNSSESSTSSSAPTSTEAAVVSVTIEGSNEVEVGSTITLTADVVVTGSAAQTVTWTSSDEAVATVADGVVTGVSAGTVTIRATSTADSTKYGEIQITVKEAPAVNSVTLSGANEIGVGDTTTLTATVDVSGDAAQTVTWSSSDETVATVADGVVTGVSVGTATIRATSTVDTTKYGELTITVKTKEISLTLTLGEGASTSLTEGGGATLVTANLLNVEDTSTATYTWTSSSTAITISSAEAAGYGKNCYWVTPVTPGKATLTCVATYNDIEYTADMTFTVAADYSAYTIIDTAEEFLSMVETSGTISGKFALGANIDLGGAQINGRAHGIDQANQGNTFSGTLDGCGYTVRNFTIKNDSSYETDKATGIFWIFNGTLRNIHLKGTIDSAGFSGLLAKEVNGGSIENCIFEATNKQTATDWTWGRNGVIASCLQGNPSVSHVITNLTATDAMCMPFFAYSFSDDNTYKLSESYTNIAHDTSNENFKTFNPNGGTISDTHFVNLNYVDPTTSTRESYAYLDDTVFTFADNVQPVLKHDADAFVTITPQMEITADTTAIGIGQTATVTGTVKYGTGTVTYTSSAPEVATVDANTGVVTGVAVGTTLITAFATIDGQEYTNALMIEVKNPEVTITSTKTSVRVGEEITITAELAYATGTITYTSSDTTKATIDATTGVLTGVAEGTTTVKAAATINGTEYSATVDITVNAATAPEDVSTRFAVTLSSAVGGAWVYGHFTWEDGYTLTESEIDTTSFTLTKSDGTAVAFTNLVGATTTSDTEICMGIGFGDASFLATTGNTFTAQLTHDGLTYKVTEVFDGTNNTQDVTFNIVSQNCELVS